MAAGNVESKIWLLLQFIYVFSIDETLMGLGWRRTKDKSDDNYKLKWTELKSQINYNRFREGRFIKTTTAIYISNKLRNAYLDLSSRRFYIDNMQEP